MKSIKTRISPFSRATLAWAAASGVLSVVVPANAALQWANRSWNVTAGGMAGVCAGNPANVSVDANGYLHLKITKTGDTWSAAELFTVDKLGFGTYQWQTDGPTDRMDPNVVLGFYPYGPAAGIGENGTNEIDIEYSRWGRKSGVNGDWTDYPNSGTTIGELSYSFSLNGGTLSTSRFIWSTSQIGNFLINGLQPVGSVTDLIKSWTYAPANPKTNIPQRAMPLGMNLWCFEKTPTDGLPVEIVIRDFNFVPEGAASSDAGGMGAGGTSLGGSGGIGGVGAGGVSNAGGGAGANGAGSSGAGKSGGATGGGETGGGATGGGAGSQGGAEDAAGQSSHGAGAPSTSSVSNADPSSSCSLSEPGRAGRNELGVLRLLPAWLLTLRARRRSRDSRCPWSHPVKSPRTPQTRARCAAPTRAPRRRRRTAPFRGLDDRDRNSLGTCERGAAQTEHEHSIVRELAPVVAIPLGRSARSMCGDEERPRFSARGRKKCGGSKARHFELAERGGRYCALLHRGFARGIGVPVRNLLAARVRHGLTEPRGFELWSALEAE